MYASSYNFIKCLSTKGYKAFQLAGDNMYFYETKSQQKEKWQRYDTV